MNTRLVLDVGNTEIVVGALDASRHEVIHRWRLSTQVPRTVDEYVLLLKSLLNRAELADAGLDGGVVGSVVPAVTESLVDALRGLGISRVVSVNGVEGLPIRLDVEEPKTVGADRIANTLAAKMTYGRDLIAVDLGTATTFDCISADGVFHGGVIAPGIMAGLEWLAGRTAKLPKMGLEPPEKVIGRRTETCIRSGIFYSVVDGIDGVVGRIKAEWNVDSPLVVATGGYAEVVGRHCATVDEVDPTLTLVGFSMAGDHLLE